MYHHTSPALLNYALREALVAAVEEGLENRWRRHEQNSRTFVAGIEAMGLEMLVPEPHRLWSLNAVRIPPGVDDAQVRSRLLNEYNIEIGAGFGSPEGENLARGPYGRRQHGKQRHAAAVRPATSAGLSPKATEPPRNHGRGRYASARLVELSRGSFRLAQQPLAAGRVRRRPAGC